ncbi:MAG: RagB/SusD family nutrient uptake outer membrane protein [Bacteroidaceae bacterium]|nr:RagB/SusD family nutrient uptake outer membrane protein [Bacteroidaceae bacterium]
MNKVIKHIALYGLVAAGAAMGLSSCEDFLTITPTSQIVEEDFWKDRNDLENALFGCYKRMTDNDMLKNYISWGEMRSDNFERSTATSATSPVANIMNANLLPTYGMFNWTAAYNAINDCNKVLSHGPVVVEVDESFSESEWKPIRAEVITLRAFCHFLLVRTYGEIPYVTKDYNNDSEELRLGQSTQLYVLDSIISDLESIKNDAIEDYGNTVSNKGRVTKKAVYALLADVYLWRASYKAGNNHPFTKVKLASNYAGELSEEELVNRSETYSTTAESDYQKCVEYCDLIIDMTKKELTKKYNESGKNIGGEDVTITLEDLLESNTTSGNSFVTTSKSAYNTLFGTGNSDESIFEFQVDGVTYSNTMISDYFMNTNAGAGTFIGAATLWEGSEASPNTTNPTTIFTKTDMRKWESGHFTSSSQTTYIIGKYMHSSVSQKNTNKMYLTDNTKDFSVTYSTRSSKQDANWIVYRMSEIYLMKAEAMTQLYSDTENLKEAFKYVREVYKRSNPYAYTTGSTNVDSLKFEGYFENSKDLEKLVLSERQREFVAEGKRWFDLVRYALRRGNTSDMLEILTRKYSTNRKSIQAKLADIQSLYSPVYNKEIKNNNLLYQNGVWFVNETSSKTDDL